MAVLDLGTTTGTAGGVDGTSLVATDVAVDGGAVEQGVVGWVESNSEGGVIVGGVAASDRDGMVDGSSTFGEVGRG